MVALATIAIKLWPENPYFLGHHSLKKCSETLPTGCSETQPTGILAEL